MKEGAIRTGNEEIDVKVADGFYDKVRGMAFRSWEEMDGMLFPFPFSKRWGVEMPFCPPMDVVFLDEEGEVLERQEAEPWSLHPSTWRIYRPERDCRYVIELPSGRGELFEEGEYVELDFLT